MRSVTIFPAFLLLFLSSPALFMIPRFIISVVVLLLGSLFVIAASQSLTAKQARDLLRKLGGAELKADQVRIKTVSNGLGGANAMVEAQIETAVRFKQEKGNWQVAEIRLGDRHWESVELVTEAIRREKIRRTELHLQKIADALETYKKERGEFLLAASFDQMLDQLSPRYLSPPLRFDFWEQPFSYQGTTNGYKLSSAGPDLIISTDDDLVIEKR